MGRVRFGNLKLEVQKGVFRPRQETEFWVEKTLPLLRKRKEPFSVLDIFCGTGCIGLFILKNIKESRVLFADSEKKCLRLAKENARINEIKKERFEAIRSFFFEKVKGKYDFIFANPPYVAEDRRSEVGPITLENDPEEALFSGKKGLKAIRRFLKEAPLYLKERGEVFMEFDPFQKKEIAEILKRGSFNFSFKKDQFGKERWVRATLIDQS